jgi:NTP pyrophosphatase (non-canonical NTP hydrolase)
MLLFDDSKKLEKALGEEAAAVIAHIFERADEKQRQELATKADLQSLRGELLERMAHMATKAELAAIKSELQAELAQVKHDILRWMVGGFLAQTALLVAVMAFLR